MEQAQSQGEERQTKRIWSKPEVEEVSLEEIADLAEIKVAFAQVNVSGDQD